MLLNCTDLLQEVWWLDKPLMGSLAFAKPAWESFGFGFIASECNRVEVSLIVFLGKLALKKKSINRSEFKCEQSTLASVCSRGN